MNVIRSKRGQLAIWVILAILIVVAIVLFFVLRGSTQSSQTTASGNLGFSPEAVVQQCVNLHVNDIVNKMLPVGGFIGSNNTHIYNGVNISFLCLSSGNYKPCINQHPLMLNEMAKEIHSRLSPYLEQCFNSLKDQVAKQNGNAKFGETNFSVDFAPNRIYVKVNKSITISKNGETQTYDNFNIQIVNPLYNLAEIAMTIANQEAKYCSFQTLGYMILHNRYNIKVHMLDDYTKIYSIKDLNSKKTLNIAIRSCAIPPGI